MTGLINEFKNQAQVDTRANLFYFLQHIPGTVDDKGRLPGAESPISDEQVLIFERQHGFAF